ncbi:hypothetical protein ACETRX_37215 [Labrys portucalensis]|uniref:Uncharacterized protein n=1 Tax=Labrys neptuniae TaxID=376174 RepID=A0ABV6ZSN7_9HYPH
MAAIIGIQGLSQFYDLMISTQIKLTFGHRLERQHQYPAFDAVWLRRTRPFFSSVVV